MTITKEEKTFKNITREEVYGKLVDIFGVNKVSSKKVDLYSYSYDMTECEPHMPDFVVIPERTDQLIELVKYCNDYIIPIVPYITGNNVGGLTIPEKGGIIVDFGKKMNKILHINENMMYALLEPGVTFGQLKKHLDEHYPHLRYSYPFAPPYAGVVGNVLLSGMNNLSLKIGSMGDSINGLEVITADGEITRIGSCFYGKESADPDSWWCRYPMPDLMGLFVNWQGMTGLITKCAVQLWPNPPFKKSFCAIVYGYEPVAELLREIGKTEVVDDFSAVSTEVAKMSVEIPEPVKFEVEPDFVTLMPISAKTEKLLDAKTEILNNLIEKLRKKGHKMVLVDFDEFTKIFNLRFRCYNDLPSVILPLFEYSGLTWFGSYAPTHKIEELIEKVDALFHKYEVPSFIYMKSMKNSHYGIFRPIIRYKKYTEEEKIHSLLEEITDICLELGCIPYKTPIWMTEKMRKKINPGWLKLFEKVKFCMDPNNIFNPGRWNT
ncbi:MAG: FAD-binding protein [Candidatus Lokiarchaeota archaeon]|nr:FAD-binding protein [Candidatus Lokiarchaeota archaeon]MBD3339420.1 FAD-binding protein [Candidatus Lokiarchaeota archaeon]